MLPGAAGSVTSGYLALLRRLPVLYLQYAQLRLAAGRGTLWFFAFCAVWAGIAVALSQPPFSYSSERIGMFAFGGRLGIVPPGSPAPGGQVGARKVFWSDLSSRSPQRGTAACLENTALTLACLGLFDAGLFAAEVANQSTVLAIHPAAPAPIQ